MLVSVNSEAMQRKLLEQVAVVDATARQIVFEGAEIVRRNAIKEFSGDTNRPPTPPHPTHRTGHLQESIHVTSPRQLGTGRWMAQVGPTIKYGRRVELGGTFMQPVFGNGLYPITTRPFPFMRPGLQKSRDELKRTYELRWAEALA